MKTALNLLRLLFRNLVLKPLDFVLFNGSGVLYLSQDELRAALSRNVQVVKPFVGDDMYPTAHSGSTNYGLPDVQYGPWGEEIAFPPGGWADRG